jgi:hypothetical protein
LEIKKGRLRRALNAAVSLQEIKMERLLKQLVFLSAILSITISVSHSADLKDGFLGIKWGTHISELEDLVKVAEKEDVSYAGFPKKSYTVFGIETTHVILGFYKDQFFATYIQVDSLQVFERVKNYITKKFGAPRKVLKVVEPQTIYRWKHEDIKIKLKLNEKDGKMKLSIYYAPLSAKANKMQQVYFPPEPKASFYSEERKLQDAMDVMGF